MKNEDNPRHDAERKANADVDRFERLQIAAERQIENVWKAYDKHTSLIKWGVIVIVAVGGFFFWSSIHDFKKELRETIQAHVTNMTARVEAELAAMTNKVEGKIAESAKRIDAGIDERFKRENIEPLIESKVKGKVDQVTEKTITAAVHTQFDPPFMRITNEMAAVEEELSRAKVSSAEVRGVLDLAMNIVAALNDDRRAFDRLLEERDRGTNRYARTILGAINTILNQQSLEDAPFLQRTVNWEYFGFHPDTASWDDYMSLLFKIGGTQQQSALLQKLSEQTRFSREQKLALFRDVLSSSGSLELYSRACRLVNAETNMNLNILGAPSYLAYVKSELAALTISNSTEALKLNQQDASLYLRRASAYFERKDFDRAAPDLKKAVSLNPTNAEVLNGIAWLLATSPSNSIRDGKAAVDLATKACQAVDWKTWNYVGTLAAAYAEAGDFDRAIKYQKQSMAMQDVPEEARPGQARRLSLFEQRKPTHEGPD